MTAHEISDALNSANRFIQLRMPFIRSWTFGEKASLQLQCDIHMEPLRTEIAIALIIGMITIVKP